MRRMKGFGRFCLVLVCLVVLALSPVPGLSEASAAETVVEQPSDAFADSSHHGLDHGHAHHGHAHHGPMHDVTDHDHSPAVLADGRVAALVVALDESWGLVASNALPAPGSRIDRPPRV